MIASFLKFDAALTLWISGHIPHGPVLNAFFSFLSFQGITIAIWLAVMFLFIAVEERHDKKFIFRFFLSLFVTFILVNFVLKTAIPRIRPYMAVPIAASCPTDSSFPSGHAAVAFAAATMLAMHDKKRKWLYFAMACLISLSRIYLYCHYLLDVIAGGLVGSIISFLAAQGGISHSTKRAHVHKK